MTNRELAKALRLCGGTRTVEECQNGCPFFRGPDAELCVPGMTAACADALENHETHVAVLQREIEWLRKKVPQWISVEERLPKCREDVLVVAYWHEGWNVYIGWCIPEKGRWYVRVTGNCVRNPKVTHWMPLPEPPEVEA